MERDRARRATNQNKSHTFVSKAGDRMTLKSLATGVRFPGNSEAPLSLLCSFRIQYIRFYFKKHGRWPKLRELGEVRDDIRESISQDEWYEKEENKWTSDLFKNVYIA